MEDVFVFWCVHEVRKYLIVLVRNGIIFDNPSDKMAQSEEGRPENVVDKEWGLPELLTYDTNHFANNMLLRKSCDL